MIDLGLEIRTVEGLILTRVSDYSGVVPSVGDRIVHDGEWRVVDREWLVSRSSVILCTIIVDRPRTKDGGV